MGIGPVEAMAMLVFLAEAIELPGQRKCSKQGFLLLTRVRLGHP